LRPTFPANQRPPFKPILGTVMQTTQNNIRLFKVAISTYIAVYKLVPRVKLSQVGSKAVSTFTEWNFVYIISTIRP
jgi:hypothetical protein